MERRTPVVILASLALLLPTIARSQNWTNITPTVQAADIKHLFAYDNLHAWGLERYLSEVYYTSDGGDTWRSVLVGSGTNYGIFFVDAQKGWVVGGGGQVYTSGDYGAHWSVQDSTVWNDLYAVFFLDRQKGWAVGAGGTVVKTLNGGSLWTDVTADIGATNSLLDIWFLDNLHGWMVGYNQALWTEDGGTTWYFTPAPQPQPFNATRVRFFDSQVGLASVLTNDQDACSSGTDKVWRTDNGGQTWTTVLTLNRFVQDLDITSSTNARIITQQGDQFTTINQGQTWQQQPDLYTFKRAHTIDMLGSGSFGVLSGINGTVMITRDGGASWLPRGSGTTSDIVDLAFLDSQRGWYVGGNSLFSTGDGGLHWTLIANSYWCDYDDGYNMQTVDVLPDGSVVAVGNFDEYSGGSGYVVFKSTDGGVTFDEFRQYNETLYISDATFPDSNHGFAVGIFSGIRASSDGGIIWDTQTSPISDSWYGVDFLNATSGWAAGWGGNIIRTTNGSTWSVTANVGSNLKGIAMTSSTSGWAVGGSGKIFKTTNGNDWTLALTFGTGTYQRVAFADSSKGWAVGDGGAILHCTDGTNWIPQASSTTSSLYALDVHGTNLAWAAGGGGTILKYESSPPPVAVAGGDQLVNEGAQVNLDGSGSSDPQSLPLTYLWEKISGPTINITNANQAQASFTAPSVCAQTDITIRLTVSNGSSSATDDVKITVSDTANQPPVAAIAAVPPVSEGNLVTLNGGGSTDDCGGLTFFWAQSAGPSVSFTNGAQTTSFTAPTVCAQTLFSFQLTVTDSGAQSDQASIDVTLNDTVNTQPTANAGQDQTVNEGSLVTLDGGQSTDDCPSLLTYQWQQQSGLTVTLSTPGSASTQFTAPPVCTTSDLVFRLQVSDGTSQATDTIAVHVQNVGALPPVADAGANFQAPEQTQVQLDGSASHADCGDLSYQWTQLSGTTVSLSGANTAQPTFQAPSVADCSTLPLTFRLTVTDQNTQTDLDEITVTIVAAGSPRPVASAGPDRQVQEGTLVGLDGTGSTGGCGELTYQWSQDSGPAVTLQDETTAQPNFTAPQVDAETTLVFSLIVADGVQTSSPDSVSITVTEEPVSGPPQIEETANTLATVGLPYVYDEDGKAEAAGDRPILWSVTQGAGGGFHIDPATGAVGWLPDQAGEVEFTIRAQNDAGSDEYSFTVTVSDAQGIPPNASIVTDPYPAEGEAPFAVTFDGSYSSAPGSQIISYRWYFGDGSPIEYGESASHTYLRAAGYTARLVITDARGQTATASVTVVVTESGGTGDLPPIAKIVASETEGIDSLSVDFSCDCLPGSAPITAWIWDFAYGTQSYLPEVSNSFGVGRYRVWLTVLDQNGLQSYDWIDITVKEGGNMPPFVEAGASPVAGTAPLTVQFIGVAVDVDGAIERISWDFGDGETSDKDQTSHRYTEAGYYFATFEAEDDQGLTAKATLEIRLAGSSGGMPPQIISAPGTEAKAGQVYRYDTDGLPTARGSPPFTWSFAEEFAVSPAHPAGMTIDPDSGDIFWTPSANQAGEQRVTLGVKSAFGQDLQEFIVEVSSDGIPPSPDSSCGCMASHPMAGGLPLLFLLLALQLAQRRKRSG